MLKMKMLLGGILLTVLTAAAPASASWLDGAFGLRDLSFGDEGVSLGWRYPLPAYVWALIVLAAAGYAGWSYSGLIGPRGVRLTLAAVRAVTILLVAALLAGPVLIKPDEQVEPDLLLVLVDRSASMGVEDVMEGGSPVSRDEAMRAALTSQSDVFDPEAMGADRRVAWFGFGAQAFEIAPPGREAWEPASAPSTSLRTAIEQALDAAAGRPVAGVVLITDGRSPQATGPQLLRRLQQQAVSVFTVPLGSAQLPLDLSVAEVDAPRQAFINDIVPVSVTVQRVGGADDDPDPSRVRIELVDTVTGEVVDQTTLVEAGVGFGDEVTLTGRSSLVGRAQWEARVSYDAPDGRDELITVNNRRGFAVDLIDRPIRVLYVEGYPRWEYRYLKNMLLREASISSSTLLLSADRNFVQEGDVPITRPPRTTQEMDQYDVIILGDVPMDYFTAKQIALIRDHVASRGAGLLWIGGERSTPLSYDATPLADLLPMRRPASVGVLPGMDGGADVEPTALAEQLRVLRLQGPGVGADDWPADLPRLRWVQDVGPLKPTADVLAVEPDGETAPMVMRLRYGAGQSLYVATDETWRWRYGRGELYFEQFWIQLVRMLGRDRVAQSGDRARLQLSHRRIGLDETVVVELVTEDAALIARQLPSVAVSVTRRGDERRLAVDEIELRPVGGDPARDAELAGEELTRLTYAATWRPAVSGDLVLRVTEPALDDLDITARFEVVAPDDELREPRPDHERLIALANQTGGQVVPIDELATLPRIVPNRAVKTPNDAREPLWHAPAVLVILLVLLTAEWIVRKVIRLV